MKKLIYSLLCLVTLGPSVGRGDDLPYFSALREAVATQLILASNTPPLDKKLVTALGASLKLINKTKTNWIAGSASLGTLAKGLSRTSLSNTFLPLLVDTRNVYLEAMETEESSLEGRLAATIPGKVQTASWAALGKLSAALHETSTNANFSLSLKSLSKAAKALVAAQKSVAKAETAPPGANFLSATITESNQAVTLFKPTDKTILDATYDSFSGEIDIDAGTLQSLGGGRVNVRFLALVAMVPGPGTYTLSLTNTTESYAYYERGIVLNINAEEPEVEFQELYPTVDPFNHRLGTGTLRITLDLDANLVWGNFTFTAKGSEDANLEVSMTGSFLIRLEVFEE